MTAIEYGKAAYTKGLIAPCQDAEFQKLLTSELSKKNVRLMKMWIRGWTIAKLNDKAEA